MSEHKMLKVTVSGSFRTEVATDKNRFNFDGVTGLMPFCEDDYVIGHACRMFPIWLKNDKKIKANYEGLVKLHVDSWEEAEGKPICIGKDIKEMSWEELQSLACYKKLREIPLFKQGDLRSAREKAYERYCSAVLGKRVIKTNKELNDFKKELSDKGISDIEPYLAKELNMVKTDDPSKSYNFAKLPSIVIE